MRVRSPGRVAVTYGTSLLSPAQSGGDRPAETDDRRTEERAAQATACAGEAPMGVHCVVDRQDATMAAFAPLGTPCSSTSRRSTPPSSPRCSLRGSVSSPRSAGAPRRGTSTRLRWRNSSRARPPSEASPPATAPVGSSAGSGATRPEYSASPAPCTTRSTARGPTRPGCTAGCTQTRDRVARSRRHRARRRGPRAACDRIGLVRSGLRTPDLLRSARDARRAGTCGFLRRRGQDRRGGRPRRDRAARARRGRGPQRAPALRAAA